MIGVAAPRRTGRWADDAIILTSVLGAGLLGWLLGSSPTTRGGEPLPIEPPDEMLHERRSGGQTAAREPALAASRNLNVGSGLLAFSVLADSAVEHYRGSFFNRAMYTPLVTSSLVLTTSGHGLSDRRKAAHGLRHAIQAAAALAGGIGFAFHLYNVRKREGGFSWLNLFYGAPIGAPFALTLAGCLGAAAENVRSTAPRDPRILGLPAGPALAAGTALGLLGTVGEAGLLHFRGAYHNPVMFAPVTLPPVAAVLLVWTAADPDRAPRGAVRAALVATAILGFGGVGFHAYGVSRNMGGWRNWSQNILNGPPLPAPPSFTGLAFAGLAALDMLECANDA